MATMNISLPDDLKEWIEEQVDAGKFGNSSDLMRDLIRREQERLEYIAYVDKAVAEGIASGFVKYNRKELEKRLGLKPKQAARKSAKTTARKVPRKPSKYAA